MTKLPEPDISVDVDLRNPGQFFACCGVLELASRLWPGRPENGWQSPEGWFATDGGRATFAVATHSGVEEPLRAVVGELVAGGPIVQLADDSDFHSADRQPVVLRPPFNLRLDWWLDSYRGGEKSELKVWAGQMTPKGNLTKLQSELRVLVKEGGDRMRLRELLSTRVPTSGMGVDPATSWTAIDVGFSPDEQDLAVLGSPATEILAMIGLQRCRPVMDERRKGRWFTYRAWADPFAIAVVPAAIAGAGRAVGGYTFPVEMRNAQYGNHGWAKPWEDGR